MMQALKYSPVAPLSGWIPVREEEAAELPFDIKSERMVVVNRRVDGDLDKDRFAESLKSALCELVKHTEVSPVD